MQSNLATKLAPIISDEEKLEVALDGDKAIIKLSTWTEDLGWCGQKTLQINVKMLDDLHRAIASARYKVNSHQADDREVKKNVIDFPGVL